jgi:uncharacterized membrane protein YkvA (DUF1232 family)
LARVSTNLHLRQHVTKILDGEILGPDDEVREASVKRDFWRTLKKAARSVPFMDEVVAAYFCAMDSQTPTRVRTILLGALAYFVLPLDALPDFLVFFGFTDDVAVLTAAITAVRVHITPAHRLAAQQALQDQTT